MNKYIKAHRKLWDKLIWDIRFGKLKLENNKTIKEKYFKKISKETDFTNNYVGNNCFLCELFYSNDYGCLDCQDMFKVSTSQECLGGLYSNFIAALSYDRSRAIRLAKIIRDIYKKADLSIFD